MSETSLSTDEQRVQGAPAILDTVQSDGVIVIRPDGVIDCVQGVVPIEWVGRHLSHVSVGHEFDEAARALVLLGPAAGYVSKRTLSCPLGGRQVNLDLVLVVGIPLRRTTVRIDSLVGRTLDFFASQARSSRVQLTFALGLELPPVVVVDEEKLAWALATLVGNALRHVRWQRDHEPVIHVAASWDADSDEIVFEVRDNGRGMAPSQVRWLFERDPQTGKAAGVALLMIRDVMVAHRGSVAVASTEGAETTFTLRLPRR